METVDKTQQLGAGLAYYHNNPDDKHYFGGFFNLAQNNIEHVFKEFCLRLHIDSKDENIANVVNNYFTDTLSYTDWELAIEILKEYFPVIEFIDLPATHSKFENVKHENKELEKRRYFKTTFKLLLDATNELRNYYTHAYHAPLSLPDKLFDFLDATLLNVCLKVKKNKIKDDNTKQLLKKGINTELKQLKALKKEELIKKRETNKRIKINDNEGIENAIFNDAFEHLLFKSDDNFELKERQYSRYKLNSTFPTYAPISQSGLVFLLSIFLSRKEVEQLKANLKGFKGKTFAADEVVTKSENSLKFMATHWVFSYLAFKGVKQRVKNTFDRETLLMQMIDELSKVPDEVYRNLSIDDKNEFLEDMNEYVQEGIIDAKPLHDSIIVHPVIRKRYENKFLYFAIRFLDEFANFPTLKFQVFTGYYLHDKRTKQLGTGDYTSNRTIKERINVFGKLSEICKYKSDYFAASEQEIGWELFPNPSYSFVGNNIPIHISLFKHGKESSAVQAEILKLRAKVNPKKQRDKRETKEGIVDMIYSHNRNLTTGVPTALLSSNEIPALLYELLINKKSGEQLEEILVSSIVNRYHTIAKFESTQTFSRSQMSKKLLKSEDYDIEKLKRAINTELSITEEKLLSIENNRKQTKKIDEHNRPLRKYIFYTNELGQEATWLANDLKRFMPKSAKEQWKGNQHSELQRLLAFYDRTKMEAKDLLFINWDINSSPYWSEGIAQTFDDCDTFDQFYENYLNNRKEILSGFVLKVTDHASNKKLLNKILKEVFIVFKKRLYTISDTSTQINELLSKPIVFPRGIFDDKPTFIKDQKIDVAPELFADWYRYCYKNENQLQSFYDIKRAYQDNFEQCNDSDKAFKENKHNLSYQEKLDLFKKKEDYAIKKIKQQDLFVKLMVDCMFEQIFKQPIGFSLTEFYQTKAQRQENLRIALDQNSRSVGDDSENILNRNFIWNKTIALSLFNGQVYEPQVKLKDIGKFRKLENDSRVKQIIDYNTERIWNKLELEDELENKPLSYERIRRENLLKEFHEFELKILSDNGFDGKNHPTEFEHNGNPNFRMYVLNGILIKEEDQQTPNQYDILKRNFKDITIEEIMQSNAIIKQAYLLIALRNKFAHNQLPDVETYKLITNLYPNSNFSTYSEYFWHVTNNMMLELKK